MLTESQLAQCSAEAKARIAAGEDPESLVVYIINPDGSACLSDAVTEPAALDLLGEELTALGWYADDDSE